MDEIKIKQEIFFEWMYKVGNEQHFHLCSRLMTEKQAKEWFCAENGMGREMDYCKYRKTGRAFSIDIDIEPSLNVDFKAFGYESDGTE